MATAAIPHSVHPISHSEASSSSSSSSHDNSHHSIQPTAAKGILRTRSRHHVPSPLLKRALERTVSIHTSMGAIVRNKRSVALAPTGPSSTARRLSINPSSPILKKSAGGMVPPVSLNGSASSSSSHAHAGPSSVGSSSSASSSHISNSASNSANNLNGSTTLVIQTPGSPSASGRGVLIRGKSKGSMSKIVGFDLSSKEVLKARKLAEKGFEERTGKSWTLTRNKSQLELDLYEQEVKKHETRMVQKKQEELDKEISIQESIDSRYSEIAGLQRQLAAKEAELERDKAFVEQAKKDIENAIKDKVMKGSAITDEKSSNVRMRLEQEKKEIKKQMVNSVALDDPRRKVLKTQQEAEELRTLINLLKKEIAKIKHDASFERSAKSRMKAAKKAQEEEKASGKVKEYAPVKPKREKPVIARSHMARMEAEKQRKAAKKGDNVAPLRSSGGPNKAAIRPMATLRTSGMIRQSSGMRTNSLINRALGSSSSSSSQAPAH